MDSEEVESVCETPLMRRKGNQFSSDDDNELIRIQIGAYDYDTGKSKCRRKNQNRIVSTKYSLLTFIPQNLFEQFRRVANFWFLIMAIIAVAIESPVSPLTSILPLFFVICVTASKQGYEDFLRYKADNMVNKSLVTVIRNSKEEEILCQDIIPGELVKITRDCDVPCDLILLKASDGAKCSITTANLDGETNLKTLSVPRGLPNVEVDKLHTLGHIECEFPTTDLYTFNGRIELPVSLNRISVIPTELEAHTIPLMAENLLLRGSRVKNTEWVVAVAVYCGQNTKLALNSKITKNKMSSSEQYINKYLAFFIILLLAMVTTSYFIKVYYDTFHSEHNIYIAQVQDSYPVTAFLQSYFSFLILYNFLIPISLYVTIEMHKFVGAFFLEWDPHLYDEEMNQPCIVNTSDLNEELGQINILFSDKTGTLTKNIMHFKQCSINGKMYMQQGRGLQEIGKNYSLKISECSKNVYTFFEALALCHTVQVAGIYQEDQDRDDEERALLHVSVEVPKIFHKSIEELNDIESVKENVDFVISRKIISRRGSVENAIQSDETRPLSDSITIRSFDRSHKIRLSLTNDYTSNIDNINPMLNRKLNKVDFHRALSQNSSTENHFNEEVKVLAHRRTKSSVPYGISSIISQYQQKPQFQRLTPQRSSLREFYAAPSYTSKQLLERQETLLEKRQFETFIDILDYCASSPDEKALVEACAKLGIIYLNDNNDIYTLRIRIKRKTDASLDLIGMQNSMKNDDDFVQFKRLQVLEFTSDRKRMSVIVMDKFGQIWLICKGAESHVLPLCNEKNNNLVALTQKHVNEFAKDGLRTLAIARRKMTKTEFLDFNNELIEANSSLQNRTEKVETCQRKIETGLELLGATAVEDALQDDVKDTLESLRTAGIKIWVLTGDKVETALNIALSCGHISSNAEKYFIVDCQNELQLNGHLDAVQRELNRNSQNEYALLIDGPSLGLAFLLAAERFRDLAYRCNAVLCCRLSPLQKSEVVSLVKTVKDSPVTAAIGDGANDVSMLQEAHVSLGIIGKEGRQAARCSDYAFAKFSMLKRIVLLHGHYFSQRLSLLVLYFFYKNLVLIGCLFFFQTNSMFSSQSVYDSLFLTLFNVTYTTLPILFISITEKMHPEDKLMSDPSLYKLLTKNKLFAWQHFLGWLFLALYHSLIIYYFAKSAWTENNALYSEGKTVDFLCFGVFIIHNVVVLTNLKIIIEAIFKTYIFLSTIWLSIFGFVITTYIYNLFNAGYDMNLFFVYTNLLSSPSFWILSIIIIVSGLLPDFTLKAMDIMGMKPRTIYPGKSKISKTKIENFETTYL